MPAMMCCVVPVININLIQAFEIFVTFCNHISPPLALFAAVGSQFGEDADSASGRVILYASHTLCISCLAVCCQFRGCLAKFLIQSSGRCQRCCCSAAIDSHWIFQWVSHAMTSSDSVGSSPEALLTDPRIVSGCFSTCSYGLVVRDRALGSKRRAGSRFKHPKGCRSCFQLPQPSHQTTGLVFRIQKLSATEACSRLWHLSLLSLAFE